MTAARPRHRKAAPQEAQEIRPKKDLQERVLTLEQRIELLERAIIPPVQVKAPSA